MRKKISFVVISLIVLAGILVFRQMDSNKQLIFINEIRSVTASADREGHFGSDYIELYNHSNEEVILDGWFLSDDETDLKKRSISNITIPAKSYIPLFCGGEEEQSIDLKISSSGEKIFLSNADGELVDSVLVPELKYGEAYGRIDDGVSQWAVMTESFGKTNKNAKLLPKRTLDSPIFSHESGFYDETFELEISCNKGETIFYTLDGSLPTEESERYTESILISNNSSNPNIVQSVRNVRINWQGWEPDSEPVDKATVVRAIVVDGKNHVSEVETRTYFVGLNQYADQNIISVVTDFRKLFGDDGIFVTGKDYDEGIVSEPNFTQSGRKWEVLGNLEFFKKGKEIVNQETGIRVYGGSSRHGKIKRMSFYARKSYDGNDYFEGMTLGDRKVHSMGTNNSIGNLIFPQLLLDRSVAVQGIERTEVFLNGEYYSNTDLIEKYSKQYFEQRFGVSGDNILVVKDEEVSEGTSEDLLLYKWLQKQVRTNDLSIEENYAEIEQLMDIQSYIDYICANVYLCNMDMSQVKNYMLWRSIENDGTNYGDTRFRWMLYDMGALDDQISCEYYQVESTAQVNSFDTKGRYVGHSINEHEIYQALKANESYCKQFVLSFMDIANVNFSVANVEKIFEKWGYTTDLYGDFFEKRFEYIVPYMAEEFGLTGSLEKITLKINDAEGGRIQLNTTTPDLSEGSWTGKYYTDYPVTVTAVPTDGYEFVGWSGSMTSNSDTIEAEVVEGGIILEAVFEKIAD